MIGLLATLTATIVAAIVLWFMDHRSRIKRRASRHRRALDYEQRRSEWRTYLRINTQRGLRRITDERSAVD